MNQTIEAVKARDLDDPFALLFSGDLDMSRQTAQIVSPRPYGSYEELNEAMRRAAEPMRPPTADELDRMAARWATTSAPVYTATRTEAGTLAYTVGTASAT